MRLALVSTFLFCLLANITAQTTEIEEDQPFKFGINIGLNYSNVFVSEELPASASLSNGFGFRLEILAETRLFKNVFVAPKIGLSFNESRLSDILDSGEEVEYLILPVSFEFGTQFQFKKNSANNRPYFFVGPSIKIPMQETNSDAVVFAENWTPALDFGFGFDKDFGYFQFSPELRYSIGYYPLSNLPDIYSGQFYFHNISIIFNFLG